MGAEAGTESEAFCVLFCRENRNENIATQSRSKNRCKQNPRAIGGLGNGERHSEEASRRPSERERERERKKEKKWI